MSDNDLIRRGDVLAAINELWITADNDREEGYDEGVGASLEAIAALPAVTVGVKPPFYFDRYINGVRMAEDVCVERETTLESAMLVAARIASKGPDGEAPVLVYRAPVTQPAPEHVNEPPKSEHDAGNVLTPDPAAIREMALWDLLEEIDAQIDLAEEISPEFAGKVQLALWAGQTKGAAE